MYSKSKSLVFIMLLFLLTACNNTDINNSKETTTDSISDSNITIPSSEPESSDSKIEINYFSHGIEDGTRSAIISSFEVLHPDIKINLIELPSNTDEKLEILINALKQKNTRVDVFDADVTWPAVLVNQNLVWPIDQFITKEERNTFLKPAIDAAMVDDVIYGLPYRVDAGMLYYRKDLLTKYGYEPPKTWNELISISKHITSEEKDLYGYAGSWKSFEGLTCNFLEFIWNHDSDIINPNNEFILNSDKNAEAFQLMIDLRNRYQITPKNILNFSSGDARALFTAGHLLFLRDWSSGWNISQNAINSSIVGKVDISALPTIDSSEHSHSTLGGWQLMIAANSEHKEEALLFAKYRAGEYAQSLSAKNLSHLPSLKHLYDSSDTWNNLPALDKTKNILEQSKSRPHLSYYHKFSDTIQESVHDVFLSGTSSKDALDNMQTIILELEKNNYDE
ncbi:MAG: ABC transporter substrate-binding protein [Tissierellales bacterium]|jgi:multiple sugar transport system substrate-binding protein|nr:ABC transporter substrate-binding protein [Tissierellales bacterium]